MELTKEQRAVLEEELIDTLIAWKKKTDAMAGDIIAARDAMAKAHKYRIWEGKYPGFKEWAEQECGISKSWAYNLLGAAKTIEAIEDSVVEVVEKSGGMEKGKALEVVRGAISRMPRRKLKKLEEMERLKPMKAAAVLADEIVKNASNGDGISELLEKRIEVVLEEKGGGVDVRNEILEAIDSEWAAMKKAAAYIELTPEGVYAGLRRAVVNVQSKK